MPIYREMTPGGTSFRAQVNFTFIKRGAFSIKSV